MLRAIKNKIVKLLNGNLDQETFELVYQFFVESRDFNGLPLRDISKQLDIPYEKSIDIVIELVKSNLLFIQSSTNPHIVGLRHPPIDMQLKVLEDARSITQETMKVGEIEFVTETTEYPICLYPTSETLARQRRFDSLSTGKYTHELSLAKPQLSFRFFETDVLERYSSDPRFDFYFADFYGNISCKYDEDGNPLVREEDQIFLKSFGLGFDDKKNRAIAVILRDLGSLSYEHQVHWTSNELDKEKCKVAILA